MSQHVERAKEVCCCSTYRSIGLKEPCPVCLLVEDYKRLDSQRADLWRMIHTVKIDAEGAMTLTESLMALISMLGETNEALAACQSEGQGWKLLAGNLAVWVTRLARQLPKETPSLRREAMEFLKAHSLVQPLRDDTTPETVNAGEVAK